MVRLHTDAPHHRAAAVGVLGTSGLRVLDLTRILAGPVATRFLAGWGADVLRIDPHGWEEPLLAPDVTLGKRCARLDLCRDRPLFDELLDKADVIVHGYRPDALAGLGLGPFDGVIDVALDAYGWTGPWARLSLARTAALLVEHPGDPEATISPPPLGPRGNTPCRKGPSRQQPGSAPRGLRGLNASRRE